MLMLTKNELSMKVFTLFFFFNMLVLSGCLNSNKMPKKVAVETPTTSTFLEALKQPIYSANLIRKDIPEELKNITKSYQAPSSCDSYMKELTILNDALGDDPIDQERDSEEVITLHLSKMITRQVESNIPFNSIIKSLSGAKKHERALLSAKVRGNARRSYLKGWGEARECNENKSPEKAEQNVPE